MAEQVLAADGAGNVVPQSPQSNPKPKSKARKGTQTKAAAEPDESPDPLTTTPESVEDSTESERPAPRKVPAPQATVRGVPVTVWDNPENDPNKRAHVGDDPTGESNSLGPVPGDPDEE